MTAAIGAVGGSPGLDRFFAVEKHQPDAGTVILLAAKLGRELQQNPGGGAAVVGADEVLAVIKCVVVPADDDQSRLRPWIFRDEVGLSHRADGSLRGVSVFLDGVALELVAQIRLQLGITGAAGPAWS